VDPQIAITGQVRGEGWVGARGVDGLLSIRLILLVGETPRCLDLDLG